MKAIQAYVLNGCAIERGVSLDKLRNVSIEQREEVPSDPFLTQFAFFVDSTTFEKIDGYVFFSKEDAGKVVREALAPIKAKLDSDLEMIAEIEARL